MGSSTATTSSQHHCYALIMVTIIAVTALICSAIQCVTIVDRMASVISWTMEDTTMSTTTLPSVGDSSHESYHHLRAATKPLPPPAVASLASQDSIHTSSAFASSFTNMVASNSERNSSDDYHPIQSLLDDGKKVLLFELSSGSSHGLGSSMIWILLFQIYFQDVSNGRRRQLVLDQRKTTSYRTNSTHGAYSGGIFTTTFPVLDSLSTNTNSIDYKWQQMNTSTNPKEYNKDQELDGVIKIRQEDTLDFIQARKIVHGKYNSNYLNAVLLFEQLSCTLCNTIQISPSLLQNEIQSILNEASIPNFSTAMNASTLLSRTATTSTSTSTTTTTNRILSSIESSSPITVAFHIRRGDKLKLESRAYRGFEYVNTLKKALEVEEEEDGSDASSSNSVLSNIKYCFVATDDYNAVVELQQALTKNNIPCKLYTLMSTANQQTNRNTDGTIQFLAELKVLVDATYFIGTFNSNVGNLVALYRGCSRRRPKKRSGEDEITEMDIYRKFQHYYNSYGVDSNEWGRSLYIY